MHLKFDYKLFDKGLGYRVEFIAHKSCKYGVLQWVCSGVVWKKKYHRSVCDFNVTVRDLKIKGVIYE